MKKFASAFNRAEECILCFALLEMSVLAFVQVVMRYVFGTSLTWGEEVLRYQICFIAFFGADIGLRYGAHIKTEVINLILPDRLKPFMNAFVFMAVFAFASAVVYFGMALVLKVAASGQLTAATRIPKFWIYLPMPIGGSLMAVRSASYAVREGRKIFSKEGLRPEPS